MHRIDPRTFACAAGLLLAGCNNGGGLTPNQKAQANQEWNAARANVLANLASDQYKDGNFEKCQETLDKALRLQPENPTLHLLAAKLSIEQGKLEFAESHLAETRRLDPKNAEADYLTGVLLQRWQQPEAARLAYARAAGKAPDELAYVLAQAEMYVAMRQPADAIALLRVNLPAFEHSGAIRDELGQLLAGQSQYDEAIDFLRAAGRLAPGDVNVREHLAFALLATKRYSEAADVFERIVGEPTYGKRADVHAALGECQFQSRRYADAQLNYEAATRLNAACGGYWLGLAKILAERGDLPGADVAVRKAASLDANSGDAQCLLGYIRLKQNLLPQALTAFHAAAELNPRDSVSVSMQGFLLNRMGHWEAAQLCFARAFEINPRDPIVARFAGMQN